MEETKETAQYIAKIVCQLIAIIAISASLAVCTIITEKERYKTEAVKQLKDKSQVCHIYDNCKRK